MTIHQRSFDKLRMTMAMTMLGMALLGAGCSSSADDNFTVSSANVSVGKRSDGISASDLGLFRSPQVDQ